ncbi:uncharacterized protein J8A68_002425 [[Candida] subhashii]|uniref:Uncharacterized protein n=1 Tax=[Candida] subhashii TaxID=561895 RepID=A0A8J5QJ72_9ASCO|nr:uncharacterized protein J8A68_002425 [[Candida] subhashii]KAG7664047.1 hypothetical protein J8A68_002425 [[Candida] subhashii]
MYSLYTISIRRAIPRISRIRSTTNQLSSIKHRTTSRYNTTIERYQHTTTATATATATTDTTTTFDIDGTAEAPSPTPNKSIVIDREEHIQQLNKHFQLVISDESRFDEAIHLIDTYENLLSPKLLQVFIYNLLQTNNLELVTILLHKLIPNTIPCLPNELWSIYISKTCETPNYLSAIYIFHNIIDPYPFHIEDPSHYTLDNNLVPFLITPDQIRGLALVFSIHRDSIRQIGLMTYFKRFYSAMHNQDLYRFLSIQLIETYASKPETHLHALDEFNKLAYRTEVIEQRGLRSRHGKLLGFVGHKNVATRLDRTKYNLFPMDNDQIIPEDKKTQLDLHQQLIGKICNLELFNPFMFRNVYHYRGVQNPIISRLYYVDELPNFNKFIQSQVENVLSEDKNVLETLVKMCSGSRVFMNDIGHVFIVSSLCKLHKQFLALGFLKALANTQIEKYNQHAIRYQNFQIIIHSISEDMTQADLGGMELREFLKLMMDFHSEMRGVRQDKPTSPGYRVLQEYISLLLKLPDVRLHELVPYLEMLYQRSDNYLCLFEDQYNKLMELLTPDYEMYKSIVHKI